MPPTTGPGATSIRPASPMSMRPTVVASLVETCKINNVDPLAYPTDVLTRIVNGHPNRDIDQLLPWAYRAKSSKPWPEHDAYVLNV